MKKLLLSAILPALLLGTSYAQDKENEEEAAKPKAACCSGMCNGSILYVSPIKFTENGVGFEVGYEKGIDAGGIVSYNLPLVATFNLSNNNNYDYYGNRISNNKQDPMFYFMPGIKFYPTGSKGKVKYAIGPSIVAGLGQQTDYSDIYPYYDQNGNLIAPGSNYVTRNKFVLGVTVNNSLNINPSPHFTMGIDFGFGFTYINRLEGANQGMDGLVNGGFRMGYRF